MSAKNTNSKDKITCDVIIIIWHPFDFLGATEIVIKPHQTKINARKSESLP